MDNLSIAKLLGKEGWCFYDKGNKTIHQIAALLIKSGKKQKARVILTDYWDTNDYLFKWELKLRRFYFVDDAYLTGESKYEIIGARLKLLNEAVFLYKNAQYNACIPLILAQMDGICQDMTGELLENVKSRNFFGGHSNHLVDSNSLAGHKECLKVIQEIFSTGVEVSSLDDSPYRHGIMHGRTLGYGTKINSLIFFVALDAFMYFGWKKVWAVKDEELYGNH